MDKRILLGLALVSLAATAIAAARWQALHPLPIYWDEANYVNQAIVDGRLEPVKALLFEDPQRPPAYRALVLPFTLAGSPSIGLLRFLASCYSALAMFFLWRAASAVCPPAEALLATATVVAMPGIFPWGSWYGTEFPLYLAVALLLNGLIRDRPIVVAVAVAIGCLSKATFLVIAGPAIAATVLIDRHPRIVIAAAIGALPALPWWSYHWRTALEYAYYGAHGARWAVDSPVMRARELIMSAVGPLVLIAMIVLIATMKAGDARTRRAMILALASATPVALFAVTSPVFVARHFSVAFLPLAMIIAIAAWRSRSRLAVLIAASLVAIQAILFAIFPATLLPRAEQPDWSRLKEIVTSPRPAISFMGLVPGLSPPEIRYVWLRDGEDATVRWLWNAERKTVDWPAVLASSEGSNVVLVVSPRENLQLFQPDNMHNAELVARLQASGRFETPRELRVGPHVILAFVRRLNAAGS